jgi:hypothetical protein
MWARFKAAIAAAVTLVLGGTAVIVAMQEAGQLEGFTCRNLYRVASEYNAADEQHTFFLAIQGGVSIPKAYESWMFGDCSGGSCEISMQGCAPAGTIHYTYELGSLVGGWRVYEVLAHPDIARGWHAWASDTAGARFYWGGGQVVDSCMANFTGAQCLSLLDFGDRCWLLKSGQGVCRGGLHYGPGVGGRDANKDPVPCPNAEILSPIDCTTSRGAGGGLRDAAATWGINAAGDLEKVQ